MDIDNDMHTFDPLQDEITAEQHFKLSMERNMNDLRTNQKIPLPTAIRSKQNLSLQEIQDRQKKTWNSISNTLQGIWESMDSIDKTNIKRIDKVFQKLQKLEELHVKNIQHSLHHIAMLRDEVATVNNRINYVFQRLSDLEQTSPSEWLEWSIPKFEIPFEDGIYLRSPGYQVGSMIWCIELRWELDETLQDNNIQHDADIDQYNDNPIIDVRENDNDNIEQDDDDEEDEEDNTEYDRVNKGYRRLGIYVSPRSVANWERLSSLKATCEVKINENDYSDAISIERKGNDENDDMTPPNKVNKKQQHFSVSGEFLRGKKLTSWGRTLQNGDEFFDKTKIDDEISVKLRIVNQTLSYQQYADDNNDDIISGAIPDQPISDTDIQTETINKPKFDNFDFKDKTSALLKNQRQSEIDQDIEKQVQQYMTIPMEEFWNIFSDQIESAKSKQGYSFSAIAKQCKLDLNLVSMFRRGPMTTDLDEDNNENKKNKKQKEEEDQVIENLSSKQKERRRKRLLQRKLGQAQKWQMIVEYDLKNPDFRRKLATFLVKHKYKIHRKSESKAEF